MKRTFCTAAMLLGMLFLCSSLLLFANSAMSQTCDCRKEFLHIKQVVENNFAGFSDRVKTITRKTYDQKVKAWLKLTTGKFANDYCPLIITEYLGLFQSHHLGYFATYDATKLDTAYVNHRPVFNVTDSDLKRLERSTSFEGIYYFIHDSSIKVAVIKDPTPLHDYVGVTLESIRPGWKKGLTKFEGKLINDSTLKGLLYMRNHRPKEEYFGLHANNTMLGGDWRKVGAQPEAKNAPATTTRATERPKIIDARLLSPQTLYIKLGSFGLQYKPIIDSILKANEQLLNSTPNLVIDVRNNGGGGDICWEPFLPYLYTRPIKTIGVDMWASEANIAGYKKLLDDKNMPEETVKSIRTTVEKMEKAKGQWVNVFDDQIDSTMQAQPYPQKIVMLINEGCGSSTEELVLAAKQSAKVILAGEHTIGNLDYSNVLQTPFSCYPYTLVYATTRSRRLEVQQSIDNKGIVPEVLLAAGTDWVKEAQHIAEGTK